MIVVFVFVYVFLSCLPVLHSATESNISMPTRPESFSCPGFAPFQYPFYNDTDKRCGLIKVKCNSKGGNIQFGEKNYEIFAKIYPSSSSVMIRNTTFEKLVNSTSCEALMNNFISPNPLVYSISINPFLTLFKCTKNTSYAQRTNAYFTQPNYNSYNRCKDHSFYYEYSISNASVLSDLPRTCEVILLPAKERLRLPNATDIFSLLSSFVSIFVHFCEKCHKEGHQCNDHTGKFQCSTSKTKNDKRAINLILVLTGSAFILMLSCVFFILWRRHKTNPFAYFSSNNISPSLEERSHFCGVSVFSYTELEFATQNFDASHELGDGGFGAVYYGKLKDGREVAVKKLYEHNYKRLQQFLNEVEILTRLRHLNLVVLYGCTSRQSRELLLVYEYIPNGTVSDHLHGEQSNPTLLTWSILMKIAKETTSALAYLLHDNCISLVVHL